MNTPPELAPRAARILIVDDEEDNRELLAIILSWEGFVVVTAPDGAEALASMAQARPDLVLLDVMMPGMSGYEVLATMKGDAATKDIPVVMVSAMVGGSAKALAAGAEDFLVKPLERTSVVLRVKKLLDRPAR